MGTGPSSPPPGAGDAPAGARHALQQEAAPGTAQESYAELGRFDYQAAGQLAQGAQGFIVTCAYQRCSVKSPDESRRCACLTGLLLTHRHVSGCWKISTKAGKGSSTREAAVTRMQTLRKIRCQKVMLSRAFDEETRASLWAAPDTGQATKELSAAAWQVSSINFRCPILAWRS